MDTPSFPKDHIDMSVFEKILAQDRDLARGESRRQVETYKKLYERAFHSIRNYRYDFELTRDAFGMLQHKSREIGLIKIQSICDQVLAHETPEDALVQLFRDLKTEHLKVEEMFDKYYEECNRRHFESF